MNQDYYIYIYINKINHKKYIGQTRHNQNHRARKDGIGYQKCTNFWNAIQKYGWENFEYKIIKEGLSLEEANYWEEYYINYYHTWIGGPECNGYNLQKGGNNHEVSEETKNRISETKKAQHKQHTEEWKQNMSEIMKGENNPFYGHKHSKETREKMSKNHPNVYGGNSYTAKKVRCVETGEIFPSSREASEFVHRTKSAINNCIYGKSKTCGGYHWERVKD